MANSVPPEEVLLGFVSALRHVVEESEELVVPVLRGSLLMRQWFGEKARPAADVDLECFERPREVPIFNDEDHYGGGYGLYGEHESLVDLCKALCRYSAEASFYEQESPVQFQPLDNHPVDGESLWTYGTPGQRYYAGWEYNGHVGQLQIDIAESGSYGLDEIVVTDVALEDADGFEFRFPAYTCETLLAAKLSWLMRSFERRIENAGLRAPEWSGEPKDLFDVHLLLTEGDLCAEDFQKSLLTIGTEDNLNWNNLEALFDVRRVSMTDATFANWKPFHARHRDLISCGPVKMLATIADRLEPLLGDFYLAEEMPFLLAINENSVDESLYLIYADWLEERGSERSQFLRLFTTFYFHENDPSWEEQERIRKQLKSMLGKTSLPWLHQLFGTASRCHEIRNRIVGFELHS